MEKLYKSNKIIQNFADYSGVISGDNSMVVKIEVRHGSISTEMAKLHFGFRFNFMLSASFICNSMGHTSIVRGQQHNASLFPLGDTRDGLSMAKIRAIVGYFQSQNM